MRLGDEDTLAVEVGEWAGPELRRVDLWAAGQWLTCDDNLVYVKQFRRAVAGTADWVRSGRAEPSPFPETSAAATQSVKVVSAVRWAGDRPFAVTVWPSRAAECSP
ncbi:hypothetical protein EBO15_19640 [Actinomadura harenae]|uniref:Uncharacterized protein n=1 Tax=Actinomadura harenae TaxID=2483351 RepID=A0A3M2M1W8_9ACTN|nr:hypothetical protein EBO15_19640 [Actinomadura harenae]